MREWSDPRSEARSIKGTHRSDSSSRATEDGLDAARSPGVSAGCHNALVVQHGSHLSQRHPLCPGRPHAGRRCSLGGMAGHRRRNPTTFSALSARPWVPRGIATRSRYCYA